MVDYAAITKEQAKKVTQHCRLMRYHNTNALIIYNNALERIKIMNRRESILTQMSHAPGFWDWNENE